MDRRVLVRRGNVNGSKGVGSAGERECIHGWWFTGWTSLAGAAGLWGMNETCSCFGRLAGGAGLFDGRSMSSRSADGGRMIFDLSLDVDSVLASCLRACLAGSWLAPG
jgi:hypothetical protein